MRRSVFLIILLFATEGQALEITSGFLVEKNWGRLTDKDRETSSGYRVGLAVSVPGLSLEGAYANLGSYRWQPIANSAVEIKTFSLTGAKPLPIANTLTISPLLGVNQWQAQFSTDGNPIETKTGISLLYGVQLADQYTPSFSVYANYVRNENIVATRIENLSLGITFRY